MMTRERAFPLALLVLVAALFLSTLSSCSVTPKSTEDALAVSYVSITQAGAATESLYRQDLISKEKGTKVMDILSSSLKALDKARDLHYLGKSEAAAAELKKSTDSLNQAKEQLKGGKGAGT